MDRLNEILDKSKNTAKASSDAALARSLGVSRASVSNWRHGRNFPDTVQCARLAELSGEPLQKVLGIVGEARALSAEEKRVWRRLAEVAAFAGVMLAGAVMPYPVSAATGGISEQAEPICIMRSVRTFIGRVIGWLAARSTPNGTPALLA